MRGQSPVCYNEWLDNEYEYYLEMKRNKDTSIKIKHNFKRLSTMTTIKLNKTTKKAESWIDAYLNSNCSSVSDFYVSNVPKKESIERAIKARVSTGHLIGYKVIYGNRFYFTCGYMTADKKTLFVETASNIYEIEL